MIDAKDPDQDPDYQLVWPADVFADELADVVRLYGSNDVRARRVLEEAFWGEAPVLDLARPTTWAPASDPWAPESTPSSARHVQFLIDHARDLPEHRGPKPYWGAVRPEEQEASDLAATARRDWATLINNLLANGYFSKIAPEECIDADYALESVDDLLEQELSSRLGRAGLFPHREPTSWSDEVFYGQVEVFHDLIARPRYRSYHSYGDCGWHYSDYSVRCGRRLYRAKVNAIFARCRISLRLATDGEDVGRLVTASDEPREALIHRVVASTSDSGQKAHAVALFRARNATIEDKRSACIALAGLLEQRRSLIKDEFLRKDEGALFQIMNEFAIRHRDAKQKSDYDAIYLDWIFWWFLASVDLADGLIARSAAGVTNR